MPVIHNGEHNIVSPLPSKILLNSQKKIVYTVDMYSNITNKILCVAIWNNIVDGYKS